MAPDANEVHRSLGRLEGKLDSLITTFSEAAIASATRHKEFHDKHEALEASMNQKHGQIDTRLRNVENKLNWYAGAGVVIGFVATQFIAPIKKLFGA